MAMTERKQPQPPELSWLDRAILFMSPERGARRIAVRRQWEAANASFARIEAAENNSSRGDRWLASRLSPDSQLEQDHETTRDRSREIYQNDAMGGAIDGKVNHVIGTGHKPQARIKSGDGVSESEADTFNDELEATYERWSPMADRSGRRSVWMLSRLAARHNEFDGESFTILADHGKADKVLPLALQVIDPERVNTPPDLLGNYRVRLGIRHDDNGDVLGYYVQRAHPGDTKDVDITYDFITADRMCHVYEPWFAEQSRGLPWMTRALNRAKDAKDYDEAAILAAQIEQCYAAFISPGAGSGNTAAVGASTGTSGTNRIEDIIPGTVRYLDPLETVTFGQPTRPGGQFHPFMEWNYRRVAAAINWPYEMVVKNWSGLSFAAGRLVLNDAKKATEVGQKMMCEQWFCRVWHRMVDEAVILGETGIEPGRYLAEPYVFRRHVWIPPKWGYALNPGEEVDSDVTELNNNMALLEDQLGKRGHDLQEFIERKEREKKLIDAAGLAPPELPGAMPAGGGEPQKTNKPAGKAVATSST